MISVCVEANNFARNHLAVHFIDQNVLHHLQACEYRSC